MCLRQPEPVASETVPLEAVKHRLATAATLDDIMKTATFAARELLQADGATLVLREGDRCYYAEEDAISPLWKGRRFPMSSCISGWCMTHDQPVVIPDIYVDARIPAEAYRPTFVRSLVLAPVRLDTPIATLGAYWPDRHEATADEIRTLREIAEAAAAPVARALQNEAPPRSADSKPEPATAPGAPPPWRPPLLPLDLPTLAQRLRRAGLKPRSPEAFGFALLCVAAATVVHWFVGIAGGPGLVPFAAYYPATLVSVLVGGAGAGVFAMLLGAALAYLAFLSPAYAFEPADASRTLSTLLYLGSNGLMILATERFRSRMRRLTEEDVRHLTIRRELEHRAKNNFALIHEIITSSLGDGEKAEAILKRIRAVMAEEIAAESDEEPESLRETLEFELEPFGLERFDMAGDPAMLSPGSVAALALAVHELATNAIKYGALSAPEGRVSIVWAAAAGAARILWVESGGPTVNPPRTRGFGSVFLRRVIGAGGGSIAVRYPRRGVMAEVSLPLR